MTGDASAIPDDLYAYSDRCTRGAQELQDWVRTVLKPAADAFRSGAIDFGANIPNLSAGGLCVPPTSTIEGQVAQKVSDAYYTDRDVRAVGLAFQKAGSIAGTVGPFGPSTNDQPGRPAKGWYTMNDAGVESALDVLAHQAQIDAGAKLALRVHNNTDGGIEDILALHANDPYFCAGFYNHITDKQFALLFGKGKNDQALVSALASGLLSPNAIHNLTKALSWISGTDISVDHQHISYPELASLLKAVAANPQAAANLVSQVKGTDLRDLFFEIDKIAPKTQPPDYSLKAGLLKVLAAGAGQLTSPEEVKALLEKVAPEFAGTPSESELKALMPDLINFLTAAGTRLIASPPPLTGNPDADGQAIRRWAHDYGTNLSWLKDYSEWIGKGTEAAKAANEKYAGGFAEFGIDLVVDLILDKILPEGEKRAEKYANAGIHALIGTIMVKTFEPEIAKMLSQAGNTSLDDELAKLVERDHPPGSDPTEALNDLLWYKSSALTTIMVFNNYKVYDEHGNPVTLTQALGTDDPDKMREALAKYLGDKNADWSGKLEIRDASGRVKSLADILDNLKSDFMQKPIG